GRTRLPGHDDGSGRWKHHGLLQSAVVTDVDTFNSVRILQISDGAFVDRTVLAPASPEPNFDTRQICARTSSLEPFAIATAITDTRAPAISVTLRPAAIWPPDGKMVTVTAKIIAS